MEYQKKMEEDRKVREAAEIERKHKEAKEKRFTESLLTHVQQFYESQSLDQLKQYYTPPIEIESIIYNAFEYVQNKIGWTVNYPTFKRNLEDDILRLFKQIVIQKQQGVKNRIEKETIHERQEKDRLCKEIYETQRKAGFSIIRNIDQLKMNSLKEIKEVYQQVEKKYSKISQLTLF